MGGLSHIGHSVSHAVSSVGHSVGHAVSSGVRTVAHNKIARAGIGYISGFGWVGAGYGYLRGTKDAQQYYNLVTGHYARQQKRAEQEALAIQEKMAKEQQEKQSEYLYKQRKEQIDAMRERIGAGSSRYKTNKTVGSTFWGASGGGETLG